MAVHQHRYSRVDSGLPASDVASAVFSILPWLFPNTSSITSIPGFCINGIKPIKPAYGNDLPEWLGLIPMFKLSLLPLLQSSREGAAVP
jgi:hypothetical protein